jgi:predicted transcriptional regulator
MSVPLKEQIRRLVDSLPDDDSDATLEELQYRLYVLEKARRGAASIDAGKGVSHEQVLQRLQPWLPK